MDQPQSGRKSTRSTDASHGLEDASATPPLAIRSGWRHPMALALDLCAGLSQFLLHAAVRCGGPLGPRRARQNSIVESPSPGRDCSLERVRRYSGRIHRLSRLRPDAPLGNDSSDADSPWNVRIRPNRCRLIRQRRHQMKGIWYVWPCRRRRVCRRKLKPGDLVDRKSCACCSNKRNDDP